MLWQMFGESHEAQTHIDIDVLRKCFEYFKWCPFKFLSIDIIIYLNTTIRCRDMPTMLVSINCRRIQMFCNAHKMLNAQHLTLYFEGLILRHALHTSTSTGMIISNQNRFLLRQIRSPVKSSKSAPRPIKLGQAAATL